MVVMSKMELLPTDFNALSAARRAASLAKTPDVLIVGLVATSGGLGFFGLEPGVTSHVWGIGFRTDVRFPQPVRFLQKCRTKKNSAGRPMVHTNLKKYNADGIAESFSTDVPFARFVTQILASNTQFVSDYNPVLAARLAALGLPQTQLCTLQLHASQLVLDGAYQLSGLPEVMHIGPAQAPNVFLESTDGRWYQVARSGVHHDH